MMKRLLYTLVAGLLCVSAPHPAALIPLDLEELCSVSDFIVVARCDALETVVTGRQTMTRATMVVERTVKGDLEEGDVVPLLLWGGRRNGVITFVPGAPQAVVGERLLVFTVPYGIQAKPVAAKGAKRPAVLEPHPVRDKDGQLLPQQIVGLSQGLARIVEEAPGNSLLKTLRRNRQPTGGALPERLTEDACETLIHRIESILAEHTE